MRIEVHYNNKLECTSAITLYENQKLEFGDIRMVMLHDSFDSDWKQGDEPQGTLVFVTEDELPPSIPPEPIRDLAKEIDNLNAKIDLTLSKLEIREVKKREE